LLQEFFSLTITLRLPYENSIISDKIPALNQTIYTGRFFIITMNHSTLPQDTTLDAEKVQIAVLKKIGAEGRLKMTLELSDNIRDITMSGIRGRHPEYSEDMVMKALIKYLHGESVFKEYFPGDRLQ